MASKRPIGVSRRGFLAAGAAWAAAGMTPEVATGEAPAEGGLAETAAEMIQDAAGAGIDAATIGEAQKLAAVELTEAERQGVARRIPRIVGRYRARREFALANGDAPAGVHFAEAQGPGPADPSWSVKRSRRSEPGPLPSRDEDIAFAPVTSLSRWIERRQITSARLTEIYLERLKRIGPKLECVITLTEERARQQARRADAEIARGRYRGALHGIPWGAKDLFDTRGIPTTYGATPYKDRVPDVDAAVVKKLAEAGAVLVAKTTLGALAYGDIWFGGKTRSPWNLERGSSGSSAGSAAGTAAGLFGFSLGTETLGSIVSPCMRCGATGLRPTFGRVPRTGAMALCWSLDKVGPITRTVEDAALVLAAISGADPGDPSAVDRPFVFDGDRPVTGLRVGFDPRWFERGANELDRRALEVTRSLGVELVEISLPPWPYGSLMTILDVEAAAAFEELTLSDRDDELVWQEPRAWPNSFRTTRFVPAVELIQAQRLRRRVQAMLEEKFADLDAVIGPSYAGSLLLITNHTGNPSLTLRVGFDEDQPHGVTLWGKPFDEGTILRLGVELERLFDVWDRRPPVS